MAQQNDAQKVAKVGKDSASPEQRAALRAVSRAMWRTDLSAKATVEEKKASWTEGRRKYTANARKLVKALEQSGATITVTEKPAKKPK